MANYSSGTTAILARMDTNPAEFFGDAGKWGFIFKDRFREVLTEPEKGALHEKLKEVRRQEFDHMVMRTMLDDEMQGKWATGVITSAAMQSNHRNATLNQTVLQNSSGGLLGSSNTTNPYSNVYNTNTAK